MRTPRKLPPWELLDEFFYVDPTSPSGLRWKKLLPKTTRNHVNGVAGHKEKNGYWRVPFSGIPGQKPIKYMVHRIIYCLLHKEDPGIFCIDHKTDRSNNLDIRVATITQNHANRQRPTRGNKTSKFKGVAYVASRRKWRADICKEYRSIFLGEFKTENEAAEAYNEAARELFGEFAFLNELD